jgi:hypothetical protein
VDEDDISFSKEKDCHKGNASYRSDKGGISRSSGTREEDEDVMEESESSSSVRFSFAMAGERLARKSGHDMDRQCLQGSN